MVQKGGLTPGKLVFGWMPEIRSVINTSLRDLVLRHESVSKYPTFLKLFCVYVANKWLHLTTKCHQAKH